MHSKIVLTLGCPGDIMLVYHLEVHLHYLFDVSESWRIALQCIGMMGEWLVMLPARLGSTRLKSRSFDSAFFLKNRGRS